MPTNNTHESLLSNRPPVVVTKEKYDAIVKRVSEETPDKIIVQTSPDEKKIIEKLLDMSPRPFGESFVKFIKGTQRCPTCGRQNGFLDITYSGIHHHNLQFIQDVLLGKYGYTWHKLDEPGAFTCYQCKTRREVRCVYWSPIHGAQGGLD